MKWGRMRPIGELFHSDFWLGLVNDMMWDMKERELYTMGFRLLVSAPGRWQCHFSRLEVWRVEHWGKIGSNFVGLEYVQLVFMFHPAGEFQRVLEYIELNFKEEA